jgi:hypothetical protein
MADVTDATPLDAGGDEFPAAQQAGIPARLRVIQLLRVAEQQMATVQQNQRSATTGTVPFLWTRFNDHTARTRMASKSTGL